MSVRETVGSRKVTISTNPYIKYMAYLWYPWFIYYILHVKILKTSICLDNHKIY